MNKMGIEGYRVVSNSILLGTPLIHRIFVSYYMSYNCRSLFSRHLGTWRQLDMPA